MSGIWYDVIDARFLLNSKIVFVDFLPSSAKLAKGTYGRKANSELGFVGFSQKIEILWINLPVRNVFLHLTSRLALAIVKYQ